VVTYLAPKLLWFYRYVSRYLGRGLGLPTRLSVGASYDELPGRVDVAFLCGLPYVELSRRDGGAFEPLAAPVPRGERYGGRPVYFSDVVVRRDGPLRSFADLRGRRWAYNEPHSQSGYGVTRYHLARRGETGGFFGGVVEAGYHERAVRMVSSGEVDAAAIDSHLLAVLVRDDPGLGAGLRVVASLGPSTAQPVVASRRLPGRLRNKLRRALLGMADDPSARPALARALVARFAPVTDASYDDIRRMRAVAESAGLSTLR
jgi:phosphonate transport system substrate-binding protein